jgi:hypothetical protein
MATVRDAKGKFTKKPVIPSEESSTLPTLSQLNQETQRISRCFYPDRTIPPDLSLSEGERIQKARELSQRYEEIGESPPAALRALI